MARDVLRPHPRRMTSAETHAARPALRRDGERKLLFGVCAGLARTLDADPALVRGALILVGLVAGPLAVIAYVATAVVAPRDDGRMLLGGSPPDRRENLVGWGAVALASVLLLTVSPGFGPVFVSDPVAAPWALVAVGLGVWVLVRAGRDRVPSPPASASEPPAPAPGASEASTAIVVASPGVRVPPTRGNGSEEQPTVVRSSPSPEPPRQPRGRSIFPIVVGALVAAAGIAIVGQAVGVVDLDAESVAVLLAVGALVAGASAAVGAGRRGTGVTLAVGILLALSAASVTLVASELDDGAGVRTVRPATAADIDREYRLGMGLLEIDLRETALREGAPTTVRAELGFGHIQLRVPDDVRVESVGETLVGGRLAPVDPPREGEHAPVVRVDADVRIGDADVARDGS